MQFGEARQGSPVTAQPSGSSLIINYSSVGSAGNAAVTISSTSNNSALYPGGSFTGGATLTGGEDPDPTGINHPYVTLYHYDALGNLICVEQHGNAAGTPCPTVPLAPTSTPVQPDPSNPWRLRRFAYNSLGQLIWASNPESGTISYVYDLDGNLSQKTSPQANQLGSATTAITYCYDSLNRLLAKGYANSPSLPQQCSATAPYLPNPAVVNTFDEGTNGIGHLTELTDQAGSGIYSYDIMGRILTEQRVVAGKTNTMSYDYTLDGSIKDLHYPSGAIVAYTYDAAGRMNSAIDTVNNINYVTGPTGPNSYASFGNDGSLASFTQGYGTGFSGITNSFSYNQRLQPCRISAGTGVVPGPCGDTNKANILDLAYDFHAGAGDNGNVMALTNYKDSNRSQAFGYDLLNRITSAQNTGTDCNLKPVNPNQTVYWGNSYVYDPWGNLLQKIVTKCGAENLALLSNTLNRADNGQAPQNGQAPSANYQFDAAGNMIWDPTDNVGPSYDQENRITGANGFTYAYDADGERVEKSNGSTGTLYWNMSPGIIGESDLNGVMKSEYVFFAGERIARRDYPSGSVAYYFSDHLKTTSIVTDSSGVIKNESDYYPWGGEVQLLANDSNHYKFNGKERDETGFDYYGARYYSNKLGRFVTPDWAGNAAAVPYANFGNPQSLNLYSYVENNPTTLADLDGHLSRGTPTVSCPMGCPPPNMTEFFDTGCDEIVNHVCIPPDNQPPVPPALRESGGEPCPDYCPHYNMAENKQAPKPSPTKVDQVAMSAEKAALKPTRESVKNGNYHEYGGLILSRDKDGTLSYTKPIAGQERTVDLDSIHVPKGYTVVGEYHTHPHSTSAEGQGPSPGDIYRLRTPERASRIGYVTDSYSGVVYRYTQKEPVRGPYDTNVYGTPIGNIP